MIQIYPETMHKNDDEAYIIMNMVVCGFCICSVTCTGLLLLLIFTIEGDIKDGSY